MEKKVYSVVYFPGGNDSKYVGSISDYRDGGTADFIPMSKQDAEVLLQDLDNFVRNQEKFGNGSKEDYEHALFLYEKKMWGFAIDELELPNVDK